MRRYKGDSRGSAGVLLCLILASLVMIVSMFCGALCLSGGKAALNRASSLSAKSLMSEYDRHLYEDYGIFALRTEEKKAAQTVLQYTEKMLDMKGERGKLDLLGLEDIEVAIDFKGSSLMDLTEFKEQIERDMKYKMVLDALGLPVKSANVSGALAESSGVRAEGEGKIRQAEESAARARAEAEAREAQNTGKSDGETGDFQAEGDGDIASEKDDKESAAAKDKIKMLKTMSQSKVKKAGAEGETQSRTLRNKAVIEALPSGLAGLNDSYSPVLLKGKDILETLFSSDNDDFFSFANLPGQIISEVKINEYILAYCQNRHREEGAKETFFKNEAEYVLYGKKSDRENYEAFKERFLVLRTALNLIHIYSDPQKKEEIAALASAAFPGPASVAAQLVIATAWAAAESTQDMKIIEDLGKVPLLKTKESWNTSWQSLFEAETAPSKDRTQDGLDYEDYLRIFLSMCPKETKLLRMMDIIQINMKGRYYDDFTINSCYTGFALEARAGTRAIGPILKKGGRTWVSVTSVHGY